MNKSIYKLADSKGRMLIPGALWGVAKIEYGDIIRLGLADGKVTVRKVDIAEAGDQSPETVEACVRATFKSMPDSTRLELVGELSGLLQKKEGQFMQMFHRKDCSQTGNGIDLKNRVVALSANVLPKEHSGRLFFCTRRSGANPVPVGSTVSLISLSDGEACRCERSDVVGTLEPELLPEKAKLQPSQIRPVGAADLHHHEPEYSGYSFLENGRYATGVWLCSPQEVMGCVETQKPCQHHMPICDRDDFAATEIAKEQMIFPT